MTARVTTGSNKICLFCGRGGKMSKEHLWPRWAQAAIAPDQRGKKIRNALHDGPPGEPYKVWEAPVFEATLKDVCVECNRGLEWTRFRGRSWALVASRCW